MELVEALKTAVQAGASDIHIVIGKPPMMRADGDIAEIPGFGVINAEESKRLIYSILYEEQRAKFEESWELDCSFAVSGLSRFRVNVLLQKNGVEAVMRVVNSVIPTPEQLRLQKAITDLADLPRGLVLVTGPTGSGKSTTLAVIMEITPRCWNTFARNRERPLMPNERSSSLLISKRLRCSSESTL